MLVRDMMDIPLESLFVLRIGTGDAGFVCPAGHFAGEQFAVVVDEKGCLLGKIDFRLMDGCLEAARVRSLLEPVKETVREDDNATELVNLLDDGLNKGRVYVVDRQNKLVGAVSQGSRILYAFSGVKDNMVPFSSIFDAMCEAVLIIDSGGTIIYANPAYSGMLGLPGGRVIGRRMEEVEPSSACLKVLGGHPPIINQKIVVRSTGTEVLANITPFYVNGRLKGVISVFRDVCNAANQGGGPDKATGPPQHQQGDLKAEGRLSGPLLIPPEWQQETLPRLVEQLEKEVISMVIKKCRNKSTAIKVLGISRRTFYLKLKKYRLMI